MLGEHLDITLSCPVSGGILALTCHSFRTKKKKEKKKNNVEAQRFIPEVGQSRVCRRAFTEVCMTARAGYVEINTSTSRAWTFSASLYALTPKKKSLGFFFFFSFGNEPGQKRDSEGQKERRRRRRSESLCVVLLREFGGEPVPVSAVCVFRRRWWRRRWWWRRSVCILFICFLRHGSGNRQRSDSPKATSARAEPAQTGDSPTQEKPE